LEDLAGLGGDLVDTLDADDEDELGLGGDVERAILLGETGETDLLALVLTVLLDVLLGTLEDDATLLLAGLYTELALRSDRLVGKSGEIVVRSDPKDGISTSIDLSRYLGLLCIMSWGGDKRDWGHIQPSSSGAPGCAQREPSPGTCASSGASRGRERHSEWGPN